MNNKAVFNWSGGKDSSYCLHKVLQEGKYDIKYLLTSVNESFQRISMHGVRVELLEQQAENIGIPLIKLLLPENPDMEMYNQKMSEVMQNIKSEDIEVSIFGDIFLEDLRTYRENKLKEVGMKAEFPIWKMPTKKLATDFIDKGFKTITVCINDGYLNENFVGREFDYQFLKDLPDNVDPCGENGEFHTFVYDGPIYKKPIKVILGEKVHKKYNPPSKPAYRTGRDDNHPVHSSTPYQNGFWYCDLLPD